MTTGAPHVAAFGGSKQYADLYYLIKRTGVIDLYDPVPRQRFDTPGSGIIRKIELR
jgi:hypothetical protein